MVGQEELFKRLLGSKAYCDLPSVALSCQDIKTLQDSDVDTLQFYTQKTLNPKPLTPQP